MTNTYDLHHIVVPENYLPSPQIHLNNIRDNEHYKFINKLLIKRNYKTIFDIGSWDGWLPLLLAIDGFDVETCEWVLGLKKAGEKFAIKNNLLNYKAHHSNWLDFEISNYFDVISAFEVLEHVPFEEVSFFIKKMEKNCKTIVISLPDQNHLYNKQHQWTPCQTLIEDIFKNKKNIEIDYISYRCTIPPNWFIVYDS